jgi:hypothetical protein
MIPGLRRVVCTAALVLSVGFTLAQNDRDDDAVSRVLALERLWAQAAQLRDIKALEAIFDDSLAYVDYDGRLLTKAEVLADTLVASPAQIVIESSLAHSHGGTVIVTGVLQLKSIEHGRPSLHRARFLDTWVNKAGRWVCLTSMTIPMEKAQ